MKAEEGDQGRDLIFWLVRASLGNTPLGRVDRRARAWTEVLPQQPKARVSVRARLFVPSASGSTTITTAPSSQHITMRPSRSYLLRLRPVPLAQLEAGTVQLPKVKAAAPSSAESLAARSQGRVAALLTERATRARQEAGQQSWPANLRIEEHVPKKELYWKVSVQRLSPLSPTRSRARSKGKKGETTQGSLRKSMLQS